MASYPALTPYLPSPTSSPASLGAGPTFPPGTEKKARLRVVKSAFRHFYRQVRSGTPVDTNTIMLAILCFLLPPLAVYFKEDMQITKRFWISLLLSLVFWVPGIVYALLVVLNKIKIP